MILLVHMLFGAAIGSWVNNIWLAIILAFLGHYFLDLFPHIEYLDGVEDSIKKLKTDSWKRSALPVIKVIIDFCLGLLLIFLFSKNHPLIYVCAIVAIIPDGLTFLHSLFPNKASTWHHIFHGEKVHFLKYKKISKFWRIFTQVAVTVLCLIILRS